MRHSSMGPRRPRIGRHQNCLNIAVTRNRRSRLTKRSAYIVAVTLEPDDVLRALAEPHRRAILRLVARTELAAGEIAAAFDVTRPAISQHLTVLRTVGLLHERREGARRLYRTRPEGLDALRALLDDLGHPATPGPPDIGAPPRQRSG
jgi:DNA-binding transcriptional ArsR family regulator